MEAVSVAGDLDVRPTAAMRGVSSSLRERMGARENIRRISNICNPVKRICKEGKVSVFNVIKLLSMHMVEYHN